MAASTSAVADINFKSIVHFLVREGNAASPIHERLIAVYSDQTPSLRTIQRWVADINEGDFQIQHRGGAGRPPTQVTPEIIHLVENLIYDDRRITYAQMEEALGISAPQLHEILHDRLGMNKVCTRWVPKFLTREQKAERMRIAEELLCLSQSEPHFYDRIVTLDESWFHFYMPETKQQSREWHRRGDPPPLQPRTVPSAGKRMATVCWDVQGILMIDWLDEGRTVTANTFCDLLENLRQQIKENRRGLLTKGVLLQMDNASAHTANVTRQKIADLGFTLLPHPLFARSGSVRLLAVSKPEETVAG